MCPHGGNTACNKLHTSQHILLILQKRRPSAEEEEGQPGGTRLDSWLPAPSLRPAPAEAPSQPRVPQGQGQRWGPTSPPLTHKPSSLVTAPQTHTIPQDFKYSSSEGGKAPRTRVMANRDSHRPHRETQTHTWIDSHMETHTSTHIRDTLVNGTPSLESQQAVCNVVARLGEVSW